MKKLTWQVIEDNGGGLHLAVVEDGRCIYYASGYEHHPTALRADVQALREGAHPVRDGWEMPEGIDPQAAYADITRHEYGWAVVADDDGGVYYDRMGAAAETAFCARVNILEVGFSAEKRVEKVGDFTIPLEPLDIADGALVQAAMIETARRGHVILPNCAGGCCVVTRYSDGLIEVAVTVEDEEEARKIGPWSRVGRALGYEWYDDMLTASRSVITEGTTDWYVTPLPTGLWAAWDDSEVALDRCAIFATCEEAVKDHVYAYLDAVADWEEEVDPGWDGSGTIARSWTTSVVVDGDEFTVRIDQFREDEGGGFAYSVVRDGDYLPGGENVDASSRSEAEEQAASVIARRVAKSIAKDRA